MSPHPRGSGPPAPKKCLSVIHCMSPLGLSLPVYKGRGVGPNGLSLLTVQNTVPCHSLSHPVHSQGPVDSKLACTQVSQAQITPPSSQAPQA